MATRKVTVTIDEEQLSAINQLVESDRASSVSGFVQRAVRGALDDASTWGTMLAGSLEDTGGPLTEQERAWADEVLEGSGGQAAGSAA